LHSTPCFLHLHLLLEHFDLHEHLKNPWPPDKDCWDAASWTFTYILFGLSQNTTIIRWLTNLKKKSNLDSSYFLFFWYEFPYLFFRWTTKEMQLLVRESYGTDYCTVLHFSYTCICYLRMLIYTNI
jgi:hypothetical protein